MKIFKNIKPEFIDQRGGITKLLDKDGGIESVLIISSKADSVRANHYHKKDTHFCYMLSGKMKYFEKPLKGGRMQTVVLKTGDMIFTPAMKAHAMKFLEKSVFIALATESRRQANYEKDTIKYKLI